jgi:hypothetical protein
MEIIATTFFRILAAVGAAIIVSAGWWVAYWFFPSGFLHTVAIGSMALGAFWGAFGSEI